MEGRDDSHTDFIKKPSPLPWLLLILVLVLAGGAAYLGYGMYEEEKDKAATALKASDEAAAKIKAAEDARKAAEEKVAQLEEEKGRLIAHTDRLTDEVEAKDAELAKLKAANDAIAEKMKAEIKQGDIRLSQDKGKIKVDLVDKILFNSGEAELSPRGQEVLGRLGGVLAKIDDKAIQVSGHTDDAPIADPELQKKYATNWELSVARAVNVVRYMSEKGEVPAGRLVAAGYSQYHPISTNANPQGRARNRRIEILLTPSLETRPADVKVANAAPPAAAPPRPAVIPAKAAQPPAPAPRPLGVKTPQTVVAKPGTPPPPPPPPNKAVVPVRRPALRK